MKEIWKDIKGYRGRYQISNLGRVKSLARKHSLRDRILKPSLNSYGYLHVGLSKLNKNKTVQIHIIVAKHFCVKSRKHNQINHKDGNKSNPKASNLEWCTGKENIQHALHTLKRVFGSKPLLNVTDILVIKIMYESKKFLLKDIAEYYGVSISTISRILK